MSDMPGPVMSGVIDTDSDSVTPESWIVAGELEALSAMTIWANWEPDVEGVKETLRTHPLFGAKLVGVEQPVNANSDLAGPVSVMLVMFKVAAPVLVRVMFCAGVVELIAGEMKDSESGNGVAAG